MPILTKQMVVRPSTDKANTPSVVYRLPVQTRQEILLVVESYLRKPLSLILETTEDNGWLVTSSGIMAHGYGESHNEAIEDFISMLDDLYCELRESEDHLAPHLRSELEYLKRIIISGDC